LTRAAERSVLVDVCHVIIDRGSVQRPVALRYGRVAAVHVHGPPAPAAEGAVHLEAGASLHHGPGAGPGAGPAAGPDGAGFTN